MHYDTVGIQEVHLNQQDPDHYDYSQIMLRMGISAQSDIRLQDVALRQEAQMA